MWVSVVPYLVISLVSVTIHPKMVEKSTIGDDFSLKTEVLYPTLRSPSPLGGF